MEELSTLYRQAVSAHREAMVSYQTVAIQQQLAGIDTCILLRGSYVPCGSRRRLAPLGEILWFTIATPAVLVLLLSTLFTPHLGIISH